MASGVEQAIAAFAAGNPVMVFDSDFRECETDLLWPADAATPEVMRTLRNDCGGLLFLAIGNEVGELFGLPWLQDIHTHPALGEEFRTPGHIPVCRESPGGLESRQGHTELAVSIARLSGHSPCTIGAEMLQPDGDGALSVDDAREYANKRGIPMITGDDILKALGIGE